MDEIRAMVMIFEVLIESEETQVAGVVVIQNLAGLSLSNRPELSETKRVLELVQNCLPLRLKGWNHINRPIADLNRFHL